MKAIRVHQCGGPEVLRLEDVSDPQPGPGQVLVRARTVGVNPVETYFRGGANPKLPLHYTPGTDACGDIVAVGSWGFRVNLFSLVCATLAIAVPCLRNLPRNSV